MVKSKRNKFKAVFIAALLFSVLASSLAPVFMEKDVARADIESSIDDPVPKRQLKIMAPPRWGFFDFTKNPE